MSDPVEIGVDIPAKIAKETIELNNAIPVVGKQKIEVLTDAPTLEKTAPDVTSNVGVVVNPKIV